MTCRLPPRRAGCRPERDDPAALSHTDEMSQSQTAAEFWDGRYGEREQVWSGNPNRVLVDLVANLPPGRALDLGAGEGGDSVWLAERGWRVTAIDVSATALARGRAAASARGPAGARIDWEVADLATWRPSDRYDLVSAFFLHSPVEFPRVEVLRRAADAVADGGHLLLVGHAEPPPWMRGHEHAGDHEMTLPTPESEMADLALDESEWEVVNAEVREREGTGPDGERGVLRDSVVFLRRR